MANNSGSIRELTIDVKVEVSEALTGLKAIQREAKEATKALKELESLSKAKKEVRTTFHVIAGNFGVADGIRSSLVRHGIAKTNVYNYNENMLDGFNPNSMIIILGHEYEIHRAYMSSSYRFYTNNGATVILSETLLRVLDALS